VNTKAIDPRITELINRRAARAQVKGLGVGDEPAADEQADIEARKAALKGLKVEAAMKTGTDNVDLFEVDKVIPPRDTEETRLRYEQRKATPIPKNKTCFECGGEPGEFNAACSRCRSNLMTFEKQAAGTPTPEPESKPVSKAPTAHPPCQKCNRPITSVYNRCYACNPPRQLGSKATPKPAQKHVPPEPAPQVVATPVVRKPVPLAPPASLDAVLTLIETLDTLSLEQFDRVVGFARARKTA
jgi:hypothetical protein